MSIWFGAWGWWFCLVIYYKRQGIATEVANFTPNIFNIRKQENCRNNRRKVI